MVLALWAMPASAFVSGAPTATIDSGGSTGATSGVVFGHVNPHGLATEYHLEYALATDPWCTDIPRVGTPQATSTTTLGPADAGLPPYTDDQDHAVTIDVTGLTPGATYCGLISATNSAGTGTSFIYHTTIGSPGGHLLAASDIAPTTVTLNGVLIPNNLETVYVFGYDFSDSSFCTSDGALGTPQTTSPVTLPFTDTAEHVVSAPITGLTPVRDYCFSMAAANLAAVVRWPVRTFTTAALAPAVTTGAAGDVTTTAATVNGTVNPHSAATTYHFDYGTTDGYGSSTTPTDAGSGAADVTASAALTGLTPATTYHYRLVAANATGATSGADMTFSTASAPAGGGGTPIGPSGLQPVMPVTPATAATQLAVKCSGGQLTLTNLIIHGRRVLISGAASLTLAHKQAKIVFAGTKVVAKPTIAADGSITATAPLPPAAIRSTSRARYSVQVGKARSANLKLTRRLVLNPPTSKNHKVTLTGAVALPLTRPVAPIVVAASTSCAAPHTVARITPRANGTYRITVPAPARAQAAVYRLTTKVRNTLRSGRTFPTASLPAYVALG